MADESASFAQRVKDANDIVGAGEPSLALKHP
jgi:hypothetical protein